MAGSRLFEMPLHSRRRISGAGRGHSTRLLARLVAPRLRTPRGRQFFTAATSASLGARHDDDYRGFAQPAHLARPGDQAKRRHSSHGQSGSHQNRGCPALADHGARATALQRLSRQWDIYGTPTEDQWNRECALLARDLPGWQELTMVDPSGLVVWSYPSSDSYKLFGYDVFADPKRGATYLQAQKTGNVFVTPQVTLVMGGAGLRHRCPDRAARQDAWLCQRCFSLRDRVRRDDASQRDTRLCGRDRRGNASESAVESDASPEYREYRRPWQNA